MYAQSDGDGDKRSKSKLSKRLNEEISSDSETERYEFCTVHKL